VITSKKFFDGMPPLPMIQEHLASHTIVRYYTVTSVQLYYTESDNEFTCHWSHMYQQHVDLLPAGPANSCSIYLMPGLIALYVAFPILKSICIL